MNKGITRPRLTLAAAAVLCLVVVVPIAGAGATGGSGDPKARASASVKKQVKQLKKQVKKLKGRVEEVSKQPGPQGPPGEKGDKGDPGSVSGAAGGDLTGSYPDPSIADGAVNSAKVLNNSLTPADLGPGSVGASEVVNGSLGTGEFASSIPAARVTNSFDQDAGHAVPETLGFDSERYDTANMHAFIPNNRLTAPVAGIYAVTAQVQYEGGSGGLRELILRRNGDTTVARDRIDDTTNFANTQNLTTQLLLQAGDFVQVQTVIGTGASAPQDILKIAELSPEFSMTWLAPG